MLEVRAFQSRFQVGEAVFRSVERVYRGPGYASAPAEQQRLAAGAGAKIDDHRIAFGLQHQRPPELAALVLDLDLAACTNAGSLFTAGRPSMRSPSGDIGVTVVRFMPLRLSCA